MDVTLLEIEQREEVVECLDRSVRTCGADDRSLIEAFSMCIGVESMMLNQIVAGRVKVKVEQVNLGAEVPRLAKE